MGRIHERKQITDRDGVHSGIDQFPAGAAHAILIQWNKLITLKIDAARNFPGQALRRDGLWFFVEIIKRIAVTGLVLNFLNGAISRTDQ